MPGTGVAGPNLGLTFGWTDHDDGWGPSMNDALEMMDTIIMMTVISMTVATPPGSPTAGDRYVVGTSPTGAWTGKAGKIAVYINTTWVFYTPLVGFRLYNRADGLLYLFNDVSVWMKEIDTGEVPFTALSAWLTATAYSAVAPASYVSQGGSSYVCLTSHTSGTFATDLAAGKWGLVASKGDAGLNGAANTIYDFSIFVLGFIPGGQHLYRLVLTRAVEALADLSGSQGKCGANPAASYAVDLKKNGTTFGTATISTGGVVSFTTVSHAVVTFAIGDYIDVYSQAIADTTLQDVALTLSLTRL